MDAIEAGTLKAFQDMRAAAQEAQAEIARLRRILERSTADFMALASEEARLRAAWLRVIQAENECRATGLPCRAPAQCGCKLEQDALCAVEDAVSPPA